MARSLAKLYLASHCNSDYNAIEADYFDSCARCTVLHKKFLLNPSRTAKQGAQINVGKDDDEYRSIVETMTMHPDDMQELGFSAGDRVRVRTEHGEAQFLLEPGKIPLGMLFVPYGPPTCRLMGGSTDGTGMPTSKGWQVEVERVD